jgi:endogenous inhibitor of DNA gyrase (YacG/DUF329 family)
MSSRLRCPICGVEFDPAQSTSKPFCSERCRTIDLGRWLGEAYHFPTARDPEKDEGPRQDGESNGEG